MLSNLDITYLLTSKRLLVTYLNMDDASRHELLS